MTIDAKKMAAELSRRIRQNRKPGEGFDEQRRLLLQTMAANIKYNREHPEEQDEREARGVGKKKHMGPGPHPSGSDQQVHAGDGVVGTLVDEDSQNLLRSLEDVESQIVDKQNEHSYVFDEEGQLIFFKKGDEDSISFEEDEMKLMKNGVFTHNHPSGTDLSVHDIYFAAVNDLKEVRAVGIHEISGERMEYRMLRPADGWGKSGDVDTLKNVLDDANKSARKRLWSEIHSGNITGEEAGMIHSSEVIKEMFKTFEWMDLPEGDIPTHRVRMIK